jgi:hypothetical protein
MELVPSEDTNEKESQNKDEKEYSEYPKKIMIFKTLLAIFYIVIVFKSVQVKIDKKEQEKYYKHFFCFSAMGRLENLYGRELVDYYKDLGVDKFYLADNNDKNAERFSDIFQKEIFDGTVDVIDITGRKKDQTQLYGEIYENFKNDCRWMSFFDFDEFLVITEDGKNLTIPQYLSNPKFENCDVILINWLMYSDNGQVRYENKPMNVRFTDPLYNSDINRFVKSIIKGKLKWNPWDFNVTPHRPQYQQRTCNAQGERLRTFNDVVKPPNLNGIYIKHFGVRTAEEYIAKVKRGHPGDLVLYFDERIDNFFHFNNVTEEKVRFFEKELNMTFPKYHYIFKNNKDK